MKKKRALSARMTGRLAPSAHATMSFTAASRSSVSDLDTDAMSSSTVRMFSAEVWTTSSCTSMGMQMYTGSDWDRHTDRQRSISACALAAVMRADAAVTHSNICGAHTGQQSQQVRMLACVKQIKRAFWYTSKPLWTREWCTISCPGISVSDAWL